MRPSNLPKVLLVQIADNVTLTTDGTASDRYRLCDNEAAMGIQDCGPIVNSIRPLNKSDNRTPNLRWYVVVQGSLDNKTWSTPVALHSYVSANGQVVQPDYTNLDNLAWPYLRFSLACSNASGTARETADVSAWLVLTMKS